MICLKLNIFFTPFHFSRRLPLKLYNLQNHSSVYLENLYKSARCSREWFGVSCLYLSIQVGIDVVELRRHVEPLFLHVNSRTLHKRSEPTYFNYRVSHIKSDHVNGFNYDLGDKSENLRRMNHFEKFNKVNRIFYLQKMPDFLSIMCVFRC